MAAIQSNTEAWGGHSFLEVETYIKGVFGNFIPEAGGNSVNLNAISGNKVLIFDNRTSITNAPTTASHQYGLFIQYEIGRVRYNIWIDSPTDNLIRLFMRAAYYNSSSSLWNYYTWNEFKK